MVKKLSLLLVLTLLLSSCAVPDVVAPSFAPVEETPIPTVSPAPTPEFEVTALREGGYAAVARAEEYISLRITDSTRGARIAKLPVGAVVHVLELHERFARVDTADGLRGYVLHEYLAPVAAANFTTIAPALGEATVVCRDFVTLRPEPEVGEEALGLLDPGSLVEVLSADAQGDFVQVYAPDAERTGWVRLDYLTPGRVVVEDAPEEPAPTEQPSEEPTEERTRFAVRCEQYLTLRAEPSTSAQSLLQIPAGEKVTFAGEHEGAFTRVAYDGETGWVLSGYLDCGEAELSIVEPVKEYSYEQMVEDAKALRKRYKHDVKLEVYGESELGRELYALILGDEEAEHHILIQAAMHGREHMTALLAMAQAEALLREGVPENVCLHILPMVNPDGVTISQTAEMTKALREIYGSDKKKGYTQLDEEQYLTLWKANAVGVDLNRNFDAAHRVGIAGGAERNAVSASHYPGKHPENQPESRALADYLRSCDFSATLSYHAYGSTLFYQYGENAEVNAQSKALGKAIRSVTGYDLSGNDDTTGGGFKDYAMDALGIPSVTIEIGTRSCPLPLDEFSAIWLRNREVLPRVCAWVTQGE